MKEDIKKLLDWLFAPKVLKSKYDEDINNLINEIDGLKKLKESIRIRNVGLIKENAELKEQLRQKYIKDLKHESLERFKEYLSTIPPTIKKYDFGYGSRAVHTFFKASIQDTEIIWEFIEDMLGFDGSRYDNADDLVYQFNRLLSKKYPTNLYYASDITLYGKIEYWALAKETIQRIKDNKKYLFDCDDSMGLRYSCLYHLLDNYFPEDKWRLRGFIVDLWTAGGHAMLSWVKEGINDWVPIETTFYDNKQGTIWFDDYPMTKQMLYQIRYSFDHEAEYVKQ